MKFEFSQPKPKTYEERKQEWLNAVKAKPDYYLNAPDDLRNDLDIAWTAVQKEPNLINHLGLKLAIQCKGENPIKRLEVLATHSQLEATMVQKQEQPRKGMKL